MRSWLIFAATLVATPVSAQSLTEHKAWLTGPVDGGCITFIGYEGKGSPRLILASLTDGSNTLVLSKEGWSTQLGQRLGLKVFLDSRYFDATALGLELEDGRGGVGFDVDGDFIAAFAKARVIVIEYDGKTVESLSLAGSGGAISDLTRCVAHAKAIRTPEQRDRDRESIIPADPFRRPTDRPRRPETPLATSAVPRGAAEGWITNDDYPADALRERRQGTVHYSLVIDASGRVSGCTIVTSSGSPSLDTATCSLLKRRARFTPAEDGDGNKAPATWSGQFRWALPAN